MTTSLIVISYVSGIAAILHGFGRPASDWVAADRNRGFWLTTMITGTALGVGLIAAAFYFVGVAPRYTSGVDSAFRK